jgi:phosphohistidine phosphatase SixA
MTRGGPTPMSMQRWNGGMRGSTSVGGLLVLALLLWSPAPGQADMETAAWAALKNGDHVALLRHASAPGTDDPPGFRLDDCSTQRNLSEAGREQARSIGARFREHGIENVVIYSSQWCRCLETAKLLDLGKVNRFPGLNSFFRDGSREAVQTAEVRELINQRPKGTSLVLVTHQVNITALSGVSPQSGEIVVLRPDGENLTVVGRIPHR